MKWIFLTLATSATGTIDRIEGDFAVIELASGHLVDLPLTALPGCAQEGIAVTSRCGAVRCTMRAQCTRKKTTQPPFNSPIQE